MVQRCRKFKKKGKKGNNEREKNIKLGHPSMEKDPCQSPSNAAVIFTVLYACAIGRFTLEHKIHHIIYKTGSCRFIYRLIREEVSE